MSKQKSAVQSNDWQGEIQATVIYLDAAELKPNDSASVKDPHLRVFARTLGQTMRNARRECWKLTGHGNTLQSPPWFYAKMLGQTMRNSGLCSELASPPVGCVRRWHLHEVPFPQRLRETSLFLPPAMWHLKAAIRILSRQRNKLVAVKTATRMLNRLAFLDRPLKHHVRKVVKPHHDRMARRHLNAAGQRVAELYLYYARQDIARTLAEIQQHSQSRPR